jgi:hypothetical protein
VDHVGNTTTTSNRTLTVDTTGPTAPGVPVDDKDNPTNDKSVTWTWDASSDLYSGVDYYEWYINKDGFLFASNQVDSDVTSKTRWLGGGDGEYVFYVRAVDGLGNASSYVASEALVLDTTRPETPILLTPEDGYATNYQYPSLDWSDVGDAVKYRFQICYNNPDVDGSCDQERLVTTNVSYRNLTNDLDEDNYWWRVRSIDAAGNLSLWSATNSLTIDLTNPYSSVDTLAEYINTERFNVNVTSGDQSPMLPLVIEVPEGPTPSGVDYIELWYRKDNHECPVIEADAVSVMIRRDVCIDGYVQYKHFVEGGDLEVGTLETGSGYWSEKFDPNAPIEFDTTQINEDGNSIGGDGYYEFFSVAVDKAGNRENYPGYLPFGLAETLGVILDSHDADTIVDTQKPVITLTGAAEINLVVGGTYNELGAVWTDVQDGTGAAIVGGAAVNTGAVGKYTVTYNYTDKAGNIAAQVVRTVNVVAAPIVLTPGVTAVAGALEIGDEPAEEVLGEEDAENNQDIAGQEDQNDENVDSAKECYIILGICWYWWLLLMLLVAAGVWTYGHRRKDRL